MDKSSADLIHDGLTELTSAADDAIALIDCARAQRQNESGLEIDDGDNVDRVLIIAGDRVKKMLDMLETLAPLIEPKPGVDYQVDERR